MEALEYGSFGSRREALLIHNSITPSPLRPYVLFACRNGFNGTAGSAGSALTGTVSAFTGAGSSILSSR